MKYKLLAGAALLAFGAFPAYADVITFDGFSSSAGSGNTGTDTQGSPWVWSKTSTGYSVWGVPGLGAGEAIFNTTTGYKAEDFAVSFVSFVRPSIINETPSPSPQGYNEYTRFSSDIGGVYYAWTPVYDGTKSVTFNAPSEAAWLSNGDKFFVNIVFEEKSLTGNNTGFTAAFSAIPEISTWAMMLAGFGALGFVGYSRKKVGLEG
jgi:hypothetical protein